MTESDNRDASEAKARDEAIAARRYLIMGLVRICGLASVMLGIAIARAVIDAPYALGVVLAVGGLVGFFFGPIMLAKHWKAGDRGER